MLFHTKQQLAAMKLNGFILALEEQLQQKTSALSFEERFALLVEREYSYRENRKRRIVKKSKK